MKKFLPLFIAITLSINMLPKALAVDVSPDTYLAEKIENYKTCYESFDVEGQKRYIYDEFGNEIYNEFVGGSVWEKYEYDGNNNLVYSEDSSNNRIRYTYDNVGRLLLEERILFSGIAWTKYHYDENGYLVLKEGYTGSYTKNTYDERGDLVYVEEVTVGLNGSSSTWDKYEYDENHNCIYNEYPVVGGTGWTKFEYNNHGNIVRTEKSSGTIVTYVYNDKNLCTQRTEKVLGKYFYTYYTYDEQGNLIREYRPKYHKNTDMIWEYKFDENNNLIEASASGATTSSFDTYTYIYLPRTHVQGFSDVPIDSYCANAVTWAVENGVTNGSSKTTFSPAVTCNKEQILTFLWRACGSPEPTIATPFTDVKENDYFYKAVLWACEKGIVCGTKLNGGDLCTRAMTVMYMWQAAGSPEVAVTDTFTDVTDNAEYAQAVAWALEQNITTGSSASTFSPDVTCDRGQIVTFLRRNFAE